MAVTNSSRIPPALQAVFIASNQGQVVHEPPKDGSAFKVFRRRGVRRNRSGSMMRHPFFEGLRSMFGKVCYCFRFRSFTCRSPLLDAVFSHVGTSVPLIYCYCVTFRFLLELSSIAS